MTENDDKLIAQFFEVNRQEIADKGFSGQVMRHLPQSRIFIMNRIWTIICAAIGLAIFLLLDGIDSLRTIVVNMLGDIFGSLVSIDLSGLSPLMIVLALLTLSLVGVYNMVASD